MTQNIASDGSNKTLHWENSGIEDFKSYVDPYGYESYTYTKNGYIYFHDSAGTSIYEIPQAAKNSDLFSLISVPVAMVEPWSAPGLRIIGIGIAASESGAERAGVTAGIGYVAGKAIPNKAVGGVAEYAVTKISDNFYDKIIAEHNRQVKENRLLEKGYCSFETNKGQLKVDDLLPYNKMVKDIANDLGSLNSSKNILNKDLSPSDKLLKGYISKDAGDNALKGYVLNDGSTAAQATNIDYQKLSAENAYDIRTENVNTGPTQRVLGKNGPAVDSPKLDGGVNKPDLAAASDQIKIIEFKTKQKELKYVA